MNWSESGDTLCPIARTLTVVGDRWTMLIMRELFFGNLRFDGLQAQTGMSPHLLSTRLKRLESDGLVERRAYQAKPARYQYGLTAKGLDLYPVLMTLAGWGKRWGGLDPDAPALDMRHRHCGQQVQVGLACTCCGQPFEQPDIETAFSPAYIEERQARGAAFQAGKLRAPAA